MEALGLEIDVIAANIEEIYPADMPVESVPLHLSFQKAKHIVDQIGEELPIVAADTIVVVEDKILNKPKDEGEALAMLSLLNGRAHKVITGCCIAYESKFYQFSSTTNVYFKHLSDTELKHYVSAYQPYDKAGAYAIQEWIGMIGVERIEGDYYNVVGLPVHRIYEILKRIVENECK